MDIDLWTMASTPNTILTSRLPSQPLLLSLNGTIWPPVLRDLWNGITVIPLSNVSTIVNKAHGRLLAQTVATAAVSSLAAANGMPSAFIIIIVVIGLLLVLIIVLGSYKLWTVQRRQSLTLMETPISHPDNAFFNFHSLPNHNNTLSSIQDETAMDGLLDSTFPTTRPTMTTTPTNPRRMAAVPSAPLSYGSPVNQSIPHPLMSTLIVGSAAIDTAGRRGRHCSF